MRVVTLIAVFLAVPSFALSATFLVPGDHPTIQDAIDVAQNGDRIIVSAGTYVENLDFKGLAITVQSEMGPDVTFIDGNMAGSVVTFSTGEGPGAILDGFSIFNGTGTYLPAPFNDFCGGGIFCDGSSPTIVNNIIHSCTSSYGAGLFCTNSADGEIRENTITGNSATVGGGIFCRYSSPWIFDNRISGNDSGYGGGGIACWLTSAPVIANNQIFNNTAGSGGGAGIRAYNKTEPVIINNTIYSNDSTSGSGGALLVKNSFVSVLNTICWDNDADDMSEIWVGHSSTPSILDIDYSDVQDGLAAVIVVAPSVVNWGAGMIDADPILHDPANADFHLDQDPPQPGVSNPCVDTGDPNSVLLDGSTRTDDVLDSGIIDMGYRYMLQVPDEPEIHSIDPDNGPITGGTAVTISGDYFTDTADTTVTFDGLAATDLVVADVNTITCTTPAHAAGAVDVTVSNSNGSDTLVSGFTYNFEPAIAGIDPDKGPITGGTAVTISGDYFTDTADTTVTLDGLAATDLVVADVNTITCTTPAHAAGAVDVTVTNSNGSDTLVAGFAYNNEPVLSSIDPDNGPITGGTAVTISGDYFTDTADTAVTFDGLTATDLIVIDVNTITCTTPAHAAGAVDVTVSNSNGSGTLVAGFAYNNEPVLSGIDPDNGPITGGTAVTISGDYFTNTADTTVTFDGLAATDLVVIDVNTITCTTPAHAAGAVDVTVTNSNGSDTLVSGFTYNFEPAIAGIDPDNGPITGGTAVTISGDYFTDTADTSVTFDGIPATEIVVIDVNTITCTTPAHAAGAVDVTVTNSNGSDTLGDGFDYYLLVIHVPGDYVSIQEAIDASHEGGTILVEPGRYVETINFYGKSILVRSDIDGLESTDDIAPETTWIDGDFSASVVTFESGEDADSRIRGFTVINGMGDSYTGGGITCIGTAPMILDNIIVSNDTLESGGGICCRDAATPVIANNLIHDNSADFYGAGIAVIDSAPTITNNTIARNQVAGSGGFGGGLSIRGGSPTVSNSIIWTNEAPNDPGIHLDTGSPQVTYCDVQGGWTGTGILDRDPLFLSTFRSNFRLSWKSPCIDAGLNTAPGITTEDQDRNPRVHDGDRDLVPVTDMGCFELVPLSVPSEYATIQLGLNAAAKGNMVLVEPGIYFDNVDFLGRSVSLVSEKGADATTIDGNQADSTVTFNGGEGHSCLLEGFTIINGLGGSGMGGGITCTAASPTVANNIVEDNRSAESGGGIHADENSAPLLVGNRFIGNEALASSGGGVSCGGDTMVINNVITENTAAISGGGIHFHSGNPSAAGNTLVGNMAQSGGAIASASSAPTITNSILWNNSAPSGKEISIGAPSQPSVLAIGHSDVEGGQASISVDSGSILNWNAGMIDGDPLFVDTDDYHLTWNSPCKDSGDNGADGLYNTDFEGDPRSALNVVDMGADEYYYHLYIQGRPVPGQVVNVRIVGFQGLIVELFQGSSLLDPPQSSPHGEIFIELPPANSRSFGKIPGRGVRSIPVTIPAAWNPGEEYYFQALIGRWGGNLTRLSNLMTVYVQ